MSSFCPVNGIDLSFIVFYTTGQIRPGGDKNDKPNIRTASLYSSDEESNQGLLRSLSKDISQLQAGSNESMPRRNNNTEHKSALRIYYSLQFATIVPVELSIGSI